jgi:hypothetical protein
MHPLVLAVLLGRFPGTMRSSRMPSRSSQTASDVRPPAPVDANGGPLSDRMALGTPNSRNAESSTLRTASPSGSSTISHRIRNRLNASEIVKG